MRIKLDKIAKMMQLKCSAYVWRFRTITGTMKSKNRRVNEEYRRDIERAQERAVDATHHALVSQTDFQSLFNARRELSTIQQ